MARGKYDSTSVIVFCTAMFCRFLATNIGGGIYGFGRYDDGVYFASSICLVHGRMPYRDFVLLHPPGMTLALIPFATLSSLISEPSALALARLCAILIGTLNACLVLSIARRFGSPAALYGGLFYAAAFSTAYAESTLFLEGLANLLLLLSVKLLLRHRDAARLDVFLSGCLMGLSTATKIWGVVPALILMAWQWQRSRVFPRPFILGLAVAVSVVCLPFFAASPSAMLRYVVSDQLGRPRMHRPLSYRLLDLIDAGQASQHASSLIRGGLVAVVLIGIGAGVYRNWATGKPWIWAGLFVAPLLVLLSAPSYFPQYWAFAMPGASLLLASSLTSGELSTGALHLPRPPSVNSWAILTAATIIVTTVGLAFRGLGSHSLDSMSFREKIPDRVRCVTADDPTTLLLMNTLGRDLSRGCRVWVDVSGLTYDRAGKLPGRSLGRAENPIWQKSISSYLMSGQAIILSRSGPGLSPASMDVLSSRYTLAGRSAGAQLYVVPDELRKVSAAQPSGRDSDRQAERAATPPSESARQAAMSPGR